MSDHKRALKIIKPAQQPATWTDERGKERSDMYVGSYSLLPSDMCVTAKTAHGLSGCAQRAIWRGFR